jgi:hypothetical protein
VSAARPYLLLKGVLLLLVFDAWLDMTPHGGRYGIGDFNVTHFEWLDAVHPVPSAAWYVGLIVFVGLAAFTTVVGGFHRVLVGVVAALYTYAWMMSMLDSYQHHYLLSLVLIAFVFFPGADATSIFGVPAEPDRRTIPHGGWTTYATAGASTLFLLVVVGSSALLLDLPAWLGVVAAGAVVAPILVMSTAPRAPLAVSSSWAYVLVAVSFAVVYFYTGVSKTEPAWTSGAALQRINAEAFAPVQAWLEGTLGITPATFWPLLGHSVSLVQWVIAAAYLVAPLRDRYTWAAVVSWVGLVSAASFHLGAEYLNLQIGWFSWYMILAAGVFFLPTEAIRALGAAITWPGRVGHAVFVWLDRRDGARGRTKLDSKLQSKQQGGPKRKQKQKRRPVAAYAKEASAPSPVAGPKLDVLVPVVLGVALVVPVAGYLVDLPGSFGGSIGAAGALLAALGFRVARRTTDGAREWSGALALGALIMLASIAASEVRFDFYRRLGGVHRRHGNWAEALAAYEKANEYAPEGSDRKDQEDAMRARVEAEGGSGRQ